jgi:uncharacterized membrane protein YhaH (DUF805 family)
VFTYVIVSQIAANLSAFLVLALLPDVDFDDRQPIRDGMVLLWTLPAFAQLARRLHDVDRSGWWSLVLLTAIVGAVMSGGGSLNSLRPASLEPSWLASVLLLGAIVALWAFSLWPPSEGANRYGPNPRLDEPRPTT